MISSSRTVWRKRMLGLTAAAAGVALPVLFGIAALTWVLAEAYRLSQGGDLFDADESRRESRRRD